MDVMKVIEKKVGVGWRKNGKLKMSRMGTEER